MLCLIQNGCDSKAELIDSAIFQPEFWILSIDYAEKIPDSTLSQVYIQGVILSSWQIVDMPGLQQILLSKRPKAEIEQLVI